MCTHFLVAKVMNFEYIRKFCELFVAFLFYRQFPTLHIYSLSFGIHVELMWKHIIRGQTLFSYHELNFDHV